MTHYRMRIFHVDLEPERDRLVSADPRISGLRQAEIVRDLTRDQRPVSETVARLLGALAISVHYFHPARHAGRSLLSLRIGTRGQPISSS